MASIPRSARCCRTIGRSSRVSLRRESGMTAAFDLLITGAHLATMAGGGPYGAIHDGGLGIAGGRIAWVGPMDDLPSDARATQVLEAGHRWLTPGLIDCHTHL